MSNARPEERSVIVVTRFDVDEADGESFMERARVALAALAERPGYRGGRVGRAVDVPSSWLITTEWDDMGSYRRSLSGYDVKIAATPLLAQAIGEPSAYEVLYDDGPGAAAGVRVSDRARDADTARVGETLAMGRETD